MKSGTGTGVVPEIRRTEIGKLEVGATILVNGKKQLIIEAEEGLSIFSTIVRRSSGEIFEIAYMVTKDGMAADEKKYLSEIGIERVTKDYGKYDENLKRAGL